MDIVIPVNPTSKTPEATNSNRHREYTHLKKTPLDPTTPYPGPAPFLKNKPNEDKSIKREKRKRNTDAIGTQIRYYRCWMPQSIHLDNLP